MAFVVSVMSTFDMLLTVLLTVFWVSLGGSRGIFKMSSNFYSNFMVNSNSSRGGLSICFFLRFTSFSSCLLFRSMPSPFTLFSGSSDMSMASSGGSVSSSSKLSPGLILGLSEVSSLIFATVWSPPFGLVVVF